MANLRTNNLSGEQGQNAIRGSVNFGGYLDGIRSDYLSVADHDDLDMGQGEFTFECWLLAVKHKGTSDPNYMGIASSQNYTTDGFLIQVANDGQLRLVGPLSGGAYFEQSAGPSLFNDDWNHIAVVRKSNNIRIYIDTNSQWCRSYVGFHIAYRNQQCLISLYNLLQCNCAHRLLPA